MASGTKSRPTAGMCVERGRVGRSTGDSLGEMSVFYTRTLPCSYWGWFAAADNGGPGMSPW